MFVVVLQHPVGSTGMASLMLPPRYVQPDAPSLSIHHPFTYIIETPISSSFAARCRLHLRHTQEVEMVIVKFRELCLSFSISLMDSKHQTKSRF
ncbi:hypothetical protein LXL04_001965 [Taraxacum kok-saghyz]